MKELSKARKAVSNDGVEIYYWMNNIKDSKQPFRILHSGSSMNHSSMEKLERELNNQGYSTIIFDQRGIGHSKAPSSKEFFQLDRYTSDLSNIISKEGIEKPVLVGHSAGFMPSVDYFVATNNASQIVGLAGSYHFPDTTTNKIGFEFFDKVLRYNEFACNAVTGIIHKLKGVPREYNDQSELENASLLEIYKSIIDVPMGEVKNHVVSGKEINKWNISSQLQSLQMLLDKPMILIYGKNDLMVKSSTGSAIKCIAGGKCEVIELIDASHELPITHYRQIAEIMKKYK